MTIHKLTGSDGKNYLYNDENDALIDKNGVFIATLGGEIKELQASWNEGIITVQGRTEVSFWHFSRELVFELYKGALKIDTKTIKTSENNFSITMPYAVYDTSLSIIGILKTHLLPLTEYKEVDRRTVGVIGIEPPPIPPSEDMNKILLYGGLFLGGLGLALLLSKRKV